MQSDEEQIRSLVSTWMSATKAGDTETVLSLMTEDVIFLAPGSPPMRKAEFAAAAKAQAPRRGRRDRLVVSEPGISAPSHPQSDLAMEMP
jgi:uncharacterized protein (TIGR02246 family)